MLLNFKQYNGSTDKLPVNPRKSHPIVTPIAYRDLRYFQFNLHSIDEILYFELRIRSFISTQESPNFQRTSQRTNGVFRCVIH